MEDNQMKPTTLRMFSLAGVFVTISAGAWAQDKADLGKKEYEGHCAICHGTDGKGGGPYKEVLKIAPADLTALAKKNNGVFPADRIYRVIDGREAIESHGQREMPIWGMEFSNRAPEYRIGDPNDPSEEAYLRNRILSVIDHLLLIQQK
jgi:mono/diheme cytochrome c family protein